MRKVLLAFNGVHFSEGAFEFAWRLNTLQPILLTGVFLPPASYSGLWSYAGVVNSPLFSRVREWEHLDDVQQNIEQLEGLCSSNGIDYCIHKNFSDFALPCLAKESCFADLMIMSGETFYDPLSNHGPDEYLKDAVHASECPVIVVPDRFQFPEANILLFDGSRSSIYAIREFSYLLPELCKNKTLLVYVDEEEGALVDEAGMKELAARHFADLTLLKLDISSRKHFISWLNEQRNAILISSAFSRSPFSQLFRKNFISDMIRKYQLPVFVAHR